ncbi:MAG: hypothetical protein LBK40_09145 [Spirochaetaceae bacterium]|nr:hypothetical protein [Spirochaetaceae bacterium]
MSVRATERLIGEIVIVPGLDNSPCMVVRNVDIESKLVTTAWFSDAHEGQEGVFPATALDRVDASEAAQKPAPRKGKK